MITIQKHILLLSDFHYQEFAKYLKQTHADLSFQLVSAIRKNKTQPNVDELCEIIYGDTKDKTRKKFLQLTHHTFKLTAYLSRNYPSYLKYNLIQIEQLLANGDAEKANALAHWLNDVALKIEDYTTLIDVNKFLAQQAFITEQKDTIKYHHVIHENIELERIKNLIYTYLREHLFFKGKDSISKSQLLKDLKFFDTYTHHPSHSINILARFGKYYELSFLNHPDFYKPETLLALDVLEKDLLNNAFVCFHYLDDIYFKVLAQRLNHTLNTANTEAMLFEIKKMNGVSSFLKYWKSYMNVPELFSIAIQTSHYLSFYGNVFKKNYHALLPKDVKEHICFLRQRLELELTKTIWDDGHLIKLINVKCFYAALLLTGDSNDKKASIQLLENTLVSYQQVAFQKFLDGIFVTLIMGYFSLKDYEQTMTTYKRYKKLTAQQLVVKENDLTIDAYYFTAQYLVNNRNQYLEKLHITYSDIEANHNVKLLITELVQTFSIPLKLTP